MKTYKTALIGCGQMGAVHMEHIYYKENIEISCVCDTNPKRAAEFMRRYGARRIETDPKKCIEDADIVIIATYPSSHLSLLRLCLNEGKHVICEKPIAQNREDGEEFVELVKAHPECKVLVGYILRHNHTYKKAAQMIRSGAIGKPVIMRMAQNHHTMDWARYLRLIKESSPVIDCGVHYMDVMQWFTGERIEEVSAIGARTEADVPPGRYNYGLVTVKMSGGSIGYYEAGWSNTMSSENLKEFIGPKGRIRITYQKDRVQNSEEGDLIEYYKYPEKEYISINVNCDRKPAGEQLDYLIEMIEHDIPAVPQMDEVAQSFKAVLDADECIRRIPVCK
ncbi:MAG: Gfo/Idh/MocA family oxidoreductase [Clostridiales bacterium]|nr:Gfo/Idh/MocA family oxidoreductase [Clostridiales bacterium]